MKWFPLRLDYIPIIDKQARSVGSIVANLKDDIENGDIIAVQKLSELYTSIKKRIEKVEDFYNQHCMDQRVRYLYGSQIYLKSVIASFQGELQKYSAYCEAVSKNGHIQTPWNTHSRLSITSKSQQKPHSISKRQKSSNTVFLNEMNQTKRQKGHELSKNIEKGNRSKIQKHSAKQERFQQAPQSTIRQQKKLKTSRKVQANIVRPKQSLSPITKPLSPISAVSKNSIKNSLKKQTSKNTLQRKMTQNSKLDSSISKNNNQTYNQQSQSTIKNLSQLVFTIKMTKQEYNSFMKLKKDAKKF